MQWQRSEIVSCKTSCVSADTPTVKDFAAAFVNAVTIKSERGMIAKNGDESLFSVMSQIFPNVSLPDSHFNHSCAHTSIFGCILQCCLLEPASRRLKGKLGHAKFNKLVEARCGLQTSRVRKQVLTRYIK